MSPGAAAEAQGVRAVPWWLYPPSPLAAGFVGVVAATAPDMRDDLGIGYGGIAALFIAQTLGTVTGAAAVGLVRSRLVGPVPAALVGSLAMALAAVTVVMPVVVPAILFGGFAAYALNARAQGEISRIAGLARGQAIGIFHVFGGLGAFTFPLAIAALLAAGVSWRAAFVLLAVAFGAYAIVCRRWQPGDGHWPPLERARVSRLVRGNAGAAMVVAVLGLGLQNAVPLWLPTLMHDEFGKSASAASATAALFMLALLAVRIVVTAFLPRLGERRVLVVASLGLVLGHVLLVAAGSATALAVATVVLGASSAPLLPVAIARVAAWSGEDRLATATVMSAGGAAQILCPAIVFAAYRLGVEFQTAVSATVVLAVVVAAAAPRA